MTPSSAALRASLSETLLTLCNIPSPSYGEGPLAQYIIQRLKKHSPSAEIRRHDNSFIVSFPQPRNKHTAQPHISHPHIALIGHLDVVPPHVPAQQKKSRLYGAGASDMKAGLAAMIVLFEILSKSTPLPYNLSFIFYQCEEVGDIRHNGLYQLIRHKSFRAYFKSIDLGVVLEPTDNQVHLGCVGSYHAEILFKGRQAHSARPWNGLNAISQASSFIQKISKRRPKRKRLWGVDFYEVMTLTESASEPGKTTLPAWWRGNVNFRFTPDLSEKAAETRFAEALRDMGVTQENHGQFKITSRAPAGTFHSTPLAKKFIASLRAPVHAKQAWTDVAQLSAFGIAAVNYGPGLTAQCHREDEYALITPLIQYTKNLLRSLSKS